MAVRRPRVVAPVTPRVPPTVELPVIASFPTTAKAPPTAWLPVVVALPAMLALPVAVRFERLRVVMFAVVKLAVVMVVEAMVVVVRVLVPVTFSVEENDPVMALREAKVVAPVTARVPPTEAVFDITTE